MSSTESLATKYTPADVEPDVLARWAAANAFHADPWVTMEQGKPPYAIVIPPPNVTAALHMGHALNNTIQDILVRWRRMAGDNALWMPGTDHAGIATQTVVDKRLQATGEKALKEYKVDEAEGRPGREGFISKVQAWKDEYEARITDQLKKMGCSCDWDRQRFTMDPVCAAAVREAFFQLFQDGLIYRGKRLVNWDPATQTALADDEVEMETVDGHFWYMKYPVVEKVGEGSWVETGQYATVATTRPETMLGDTAVAVNPGDTERAKLIGKFVRLPIVNRIIPVVGDDYVVKPDAESSDEKAKFASGFLKVTPAHDPNDWEIGQRHSLPVINVMAPDGSISNTHGWPEQEFADQQVDAFCHDLIGMDRYEAREAIVTWFREQGLLENVRAYSHSVGHSYRSHVAVEPYLSDQWYVKVTDDRLAGAALRAMTPDQRQAGTNCTWTDDHPFGDAGPISKESSATSRARKEASSASTSQESPATSRDRKGASPTDARHTDVAYFITFTTHGTWLHGDERGSVDRETNLPGTPYISGDPVRERFEFERADGEAFALDGAQRHAVQDAIVEVCSHRQWVLNALHVRTNHVHCVVRAGDTPERVMNDFKSYATRRMREAGIVDEAAKVWTRHGSTRYLNEDASVDAACRYVVDEQGDALDPAPLRDDGGTLPHGRGSLRSTSDDWTGGLRFHPERYARTFQNWHENIRDWCISRQLWWGHRIPVWSRESASITGEQAAKLKSLVAEQRVVEQAGGDTESWFVCVRHEDDTEAVQLLESAGFTQDPDVLDTWFSSGLWPFSTLGWPNPDAFPDDIDGGAAALETWNPGGVLCTAREIITLWVSRMVMFNTYFLDRLPFKDVFIHAMIQDGEGQKMSKSLGNGVDPLDIIHSHGADAMRFTLTSMTTQTQDVRMPVDVVCPHTGEAFKPKMITTAAGHRVAAPIQASPSDKSKKMVTGYGAATGQATPTDEMPQARNSSDKFDLGRNFANKLWNAGRFALMNLEEAASIATGEIDVAKLSSPDRWILSRLARTVQAIDKALSHYEFANYAQILYDFFWRDLCDWYIEAVKPTVKTSPTQARVLATCLDAALRLLHPTMPFITERLWDALNAVTKERGLTFVGGDAATGVVLPGSDLLINAAWPTVDPSLVDDTVEGNFDQLQDLIAAIRQTRTQHKAPPRDKLEASAQMTGRLAVAAEAERDLIATLTNTTLMMIAASVEKPAAAATVVLGDATIYIHGLVDAEAEGDRLTKRAAELEKSVGMLKGRLGNEKYISKAPEKLVQQTRDQLADAEKELASVKGQLDALG